MCSIFYSNFCKASILSKAEVSPCEEAGPLAGWPGVGDSAVLQRGWHLRMATLPMFLAPEHSP